MQHYTKTIDTVIRLRLVCYFGFTSLPSLRSFNTVYSIINVTNSFEELQVCLPDTLNNVFDDENIIRFCRWCD